MSVVAERLKEAMADRGIDQSTLARDVGVTQGTISLILAGKTRHSKYLIDIAIMLGVNYDWLTGRSEQKASLYEEVDARITRDDLLFLRNVSELPSRAQAGLRSLVDDYVSQVSLPAELELEQILERLLATTPADMAQSVPKYLAENLVKEIRAGKGKD